MIKQTLAVTLLVCTISNYAVYFTNESSHTVYINFETPINNVKIEPARTYQIKIDQPANETNLIISLQENVNVEQTRENNNTATIIKNLQEMPAHAHIFFYRLDLIPIIEKLDIVEIN